MKPTFLVIGAAKAGTTSRCARLGSHPDVFISEPKETNFFAYDKLFAKGSEWKLESQRWVVDEVRDDLYRLLDYSGKQRDYWYLDRPL